MEEVSCSSCKAMCGPIRESRSKTGLKNRSNSSVCSRIFHPRRVGLGPPSGPNRCLQFEGDVLFLAVRRKQIRLGSYISIRTESVTSFQSSVHFYAEKGGSGPPFQSDPGHPIRPEVQSLPKSKRFRFCRRLWERS